MKGVVLVQYINHIVITILTIHALYTDIKRKEIEDYTCIIGAAYSIIITLLGYNTIGIKESLIGGAVAFIVFYIIPIGGGDMKFLTFIGLFFGWRMLIPIVFLMYIIGSLIGVFMIFRNKIRNPGIKLKDLFKTEIPFMLGIAPAVLIVLYFPHFILIDGFLAAYHLM